MLDVLIYLDENNRGGFKFRVNTYMEACIARICWAEYAYEDPGKVCCYVGGWSG